MRAAADSHHPPVPENEFSQSSTFKRASKRLRRLAAIGAVWRDHLDAVSAQLLVQGIAVVGAVTDQILGAWLRSCRSRSIAAPGGLRDGWPHACLPIAAIHGDQQSP